MPTVPPPLFMFHLFGGWFSEEADTPTVWLLHIVSCELLTAPSVSCDFGRFRAARALGKEAK